MKYEPHHEEPGLGEYFRGVTNRARRMRRTGGQGLGRSRDCRAQWVHGGPENILPIPAPKDEEVMLHERCRLRAGMRILRGRKRGRFHSNGGGAGVGSARPFNFCRIFIEMGHACRIADARY